MPKLKQKISGWLRSFTSARHFRVIRSYSSTAAKHDLSFFDALVVLTELALDTLRCLPPVRTARV
jgi:predicted nucleic acid-binding protein